MRVIRWWVGVVGSVGAAGEARAVREAERSDKGPSGERKGALVGGTVEDDDAVAVVEEELVTWRIWGIRRLIRRWRNITPEDYWYEKGSSAGTAFEVSVAVIVVSDGRDLIR